MTGTQQTTSIPPLFQSDLHVISAGVGGFADALRRQSIPVLELEWRPPAEGNLDLVAILKAIASDPDLTLPRFLQFKPDRNNPKAYARSHLVNGVKEDGRVDLHYKLKKSHLIKNISVEDARWIRGWLSRLNNRQIQDAFRAANYSPDEARMMTQAVRQRINELAIADNRLAARTNNHR